MSPLDSELPFFVAAVIVAILTAALFLLGRAPGPRRAPRPVRTTGAVVLAEIEDALGISVVVRSLEPGPPARIDATLMLDSRSSEVTGVGGSEVEAWRDLLRAAVAWKNEDSQNLRVYGGG